MSGLQLIPTGPQQDAGRRDHPALAHTQGATLHSPEANVCSVGDAARALTACKIREAMHL